MTALPRRPLSPTCHDAYKWGRHWQRPTSVIAGDRDENSVVLTVRCRLGNTVYSRSRRLHCLAAPLGQTPCIPPGIAHTDVRTSDSCWVTTSTEQWGGEGLPSIAQPGFCNYFCVYTLIYRLPSYASAGKGNVEVDRTKNERPDEWRWEGQGRGDKKK